MVAGAQPATHLEPAFVVHPTPEISLQAEPADFFVSIKSDLAAARYDQLDAMAAEYRQPQALFVSGTPKLYRFYQAFSARKDGAPVLDPKTCSCNMPDDEFNTTREQLEAWISAFPASPTAKIALSKLWYDYAWSARGAGYSDHVTKEQWRQAGERLEKAEHYLIDPDPALDPEVLYVATNIAALRSDGYDRLNDLYDQEIRNFAWFYPYYSQHARYLQEKWFGSSEDEAAFLKKLAASGPDGLVAYSVAAGELMLNTNRHKLFSDTTGLDFMTTINAFQVREARYGLRQYDWNTILFMTISAMQGCETGHLALVKSEGRWSPEIWRGDHGFYEADIAWFHANSQYK